MNFKSTGRYCVPSDEDFEPNSNNQVLKNYLAIKDELALAVIEEQELKRAELELVNIFSEAHQFTAEDICNIHELWLGDIYPSAGKYRTVSMTKDGFPFASPAYIENCMQALEEKYLKTHTPCHVTNLDALSYALGVVHVEFIVIHPFREGNGRTARLLADLMSMQAGQPSLDFTPIDRTRNEEGFRQYIYAIHAGVSGDYKPIKELFRLILDRSIIC